VTRILDESHQWKAQWKWQEALVAAERAETLVANGGVGAEVNSRVRSRLADLTILFELDDIRGRCESGEELADFTRGDADRAYAEAFQAFGIDVNALDPQESASRIRARSVTTELAMALDHWALIRKWQGRELDSRRLLTIARAVDKDYWRNRLRETLQVSDTNSQQLSALAAAAPSHELLPATLVLLGTALESDNQREQAFELLSKAQRKYPNDFWINWRLASCASLLDRREDAVRYYSVAKALRPDSPEVRTRLGGALGMDRHLDDAIAEINEAISLQPSYPRAYVALAWLLSTYPDPARRQPAQAIAYAQKALKLQPQHPNNWSNLGVAYCAAGDFGKAVVALEDANRMMNGEDYFHRFHLAMARWRAGNKSEAHEAYQQGVQWMEHKRQPYQDHLLGFRTDAAQLLGVDEKKQSDAASASTE
jgi:tetratricopeptide (TPR) repeat protein